VVTYPLNWHNLTKVSYMPSVQGPYSQYFVAYEWARQGRVLHSTRLERLVRYERPSLLDPFVTLKRSVENTAH